MHLRLNVVFVLLLLHSTYAIASPSYIPANQIAEMPMVGQGSLRVAFWNIYQARLLAPGGAYSPTQPFALSLTYLRDVSKKNLIKETKKQLEKVIQSKPSNITSWLEKLDDLWVDVKKNETITFYIDDKQHAHFYHDKQYLGDIADPEFSSAFADIWLSDRSSEPALRAQLLGEKQ